MKKYTSKHHIFLILCVTLISIKTYPILFLSLGGRDSWLLVLFSSVIIGVLGYYIINVFIKFNISSMNDFFESSYGKYLGKILLFCFSVLLMFNAIESVSILSTSIHNTVFIETPTWFALLFFISASAYMLCMGFSSILRLSLISIATMFLCMLILAFLFIPYIKINYVTPVFGNPLNFNSLLSVIYILGYFSSFGITLPYIKKIEEKDELKKYYIPTMIIVSVISTYSVLSILGFFNHFRGANIFFPEFTQAQRVEYGKFFESGEFFVLLQNVLGFIIKYLLSIFAIYIIYKNKIKNSNKFFITISIVNYIISYYLCKNIFTLSLFLEFYTLINILFMLIIPVIASFLYSIRKKLK